MSGLTRRSWLGAAAAGTASWAQGERKPNVIFILADDLGYADLGCYGQQQIQTPRIDALAEQGRRFTQVYAGSTVCAPSRCTLLTGRHTGHATVRGNRTPHVPLTPTETTLGQVFKAAGYRTGAFGKWGLGTPPDMHALPTRKGFDRFFGYLHQVHAHTYYPDMLWDDERELYLSDNFGGRRKLYSHDLIAQRALTFIDESKNRPFFLYAPFTLPHSRYEPPGDEPYSNRPWPEPARMLASMVSRLDTTVGQIVDRIEWHGLTRDTLIIFSSDNGPVPMASKTFAANGALRGSKRDLYEGGIRVPFLARWPGRIKPGVSDSMFAFWDMLPTFADFADVKPADNLDGVSVLGDLLGQGSKVPAERALYWEFHERGFQQAVRQGKWKGVRLTKDGPIEVYDLAADPGEKTDVASAQKQTASRLAQLMTTMRTPSPLWPAS